VQQLSDEEREVSVSALREAGVSSITLQRTLIIEFGSVESVFEALSPNAVVIKGKARSREALPASLK
jgi:hypothetical protein